MKKIKFLLTLSVLLPFATSCSEPSKLYVTFHQEHAEDVKIEFDSNTKQNEIEAQEPDIVKQEGYIASWEDYTVENKTESFTVNAVYTPLTYYVIFKAQGVLVEQVPFTIEDITGDNVKLPAEREPKCPDNPWCKPYWENYSLSLQNIIVNAKYDKLKQFTISFEVNGIKVGDDIQITKDDLNAYGQINYDLIPDEVKNFTLEHYDVVWDFKIDEPKDMVIAADVYLHNYYAKFVDFEGKQVGDLVPYNYETTWESINKPEAPEVVGYTTSWKKVDLSYDDDIIVEITPEKVGNEYIVTFDNGDTQTVRFGDEYVLNNLAGAKEKWFDEEENVVYNKGIWNTPNNVSLHKISVNSEEFDSDYVLKFFDINKSKNIKSISLSKGDGINGSNALKVEVIQGDFGLHINKEYLNEIFTGDTVSLNFYVKSSINNSNFRHRTNGYNVCYEVNSHLKLNGLRTEYKQFSFTKEMFDLHNEDNGDYVIYGGDSEHGKCNDSVLYIDSFIFDEINILDKSSNTVNFENADLECDKDANGNVTFAHYRFAYSDNGSLTNDEVRIQNSSKPDTMYPTATFGFDYVMKTEGRKSLKFTKPNGYISLYLPTTFGNQLKNSTSKSFSFDIYSTTAINSNKSVQNLTDGVNKYLNYPDGLVHPANKWVTYTFTTDNITADYRFLIIQNSTAGTYYLDNFHIVD